MQKLRQKLTAAGPDLPFICRFNWHTFEESFTFVLILSHVRVFCSKQKCLQQRFNDTAEDNRAKMCTLFMLQVGKLDLYPLEREMHFVPG